MITSHQVAKDLFIVRQQVAKTAPAKSVETPTNHIAVVDCSGSMASDLPKIREQLKKRLPKLLKEGDTLSMVWFSGKGQFGVLFEAEPVATLADLLDINVAVDRWLKPIGLTGFKEPLAEVEKLVQRVSKKNSNPFALFFMSDGCDNQWPREEILRTLGVITGGTNSAPCIASSTFVEYGYYADRQLLSQMAEKAGGMLIFAEDFDRYAPTFESAMAKRPMGGKRIEIKIDGDPIGGFAFTMTDNEITTYEATSGKVLVPEATSQLFYLASRAQGTVGLALEEVSKRHALNKAAKYSASIGPDIYGLDAAYAALSLFAVRMKPEVVLPLLKATGDVHFIERFASCFGKQKYSEFMMATKAAAFDDVLRFMNGYDPNKVPADDAFTVLDLLRVLSEDDNARILFDHPSFKYSRIGRGRVDANEGFYVAEQKRLDEIGELLKNKKLKPADAKALRDEMTKILAAKQEALKFEAEPAPDGYAIESLTYNESRPNVSVLVLKPGKIDVSARLNRPARVPSVVPTKIWRNYTIVKDGLVNVAVLPMQMSGSTLKKLEAAGVETWGKKFLNGDAQVEVVVNVSPLPILNRKMVKAVTAESLIVLEHELTKQCARQKVFNHYVKEKFPETKGQSFVDMYGEDGQLWLKEQGISSMGFSPKTVAAEATDFYMGKELNVKLKGMSTLPSVKDVVAGKSKNQCAKWMQEAIDEVEAYLKSAPAKLHQDWLVGLQKVTTATVRHLRYQTSQIKFGVIVGQTWFPEFKSLDENTLTVQVNKQPVTATLELREIQIEI